jgi:uncharacterized integral membrane protein
VFRQENHARRPGRGRGEQLRLAALVALAGLAVLFAVLNLDEVEVNWIVATWSTPLIVVIAVCLLIGAAIGWIARGRGRR